MWVISVLNMFYYCENVSAVLYEIYKQRLSFQANIPKFWLSLTGKSFTDSWFKPVCILTLKTKRDLQLPVFYKVFQIADRSEMVMLMLIRSVWIQCFVSLCDTRQVKTSKGFYFKTLQEKLFPQQNQSASERYLYGITTICFLQNCIIETQ